MNEFAARTRYNEAQGSEESFLNPTHKIESPGFNFERRRKGAPELPRPRSSAKLNPSDSILRSEGYAVRADDVAGMAGLEPTISESKSGVLPLHYIPPRL